MLEAEVSDVDRIGFINDSLYRSCCFHSTGHGPYGFLGPRARVEAKNEPYESGIKRVVGMADQKFSVKFYLLAILFLIFDIEAVFMYPWAVSLRELGVFGFVEMVVFILLLLTGLIYILKKGVLNWR